MIEIFQKKYKKLKPDRRNVHNTSATFQHSHAYKVRNIRRDDTFRAIIRCFEKVFLFFFSRPLLHITHHTLIIEPKMTIVFFQRQAKSNW